MVQDRLNELIDMQSRRVQELVGLEREFQTEFKTISPNAKAVGEEIERLARMIVFKKK